MPNWSAYDHMKQLLGRDSDLASFENAIYRHATRANRNQADELVDAIAAYLEAAGDQQHVTGMAGLPSKTREKEVKDLYKRVMMKAHMFDSSAMGEGTMKITLGELRQIINEEASDCQKDYEAGGLTYEEYVDCLRRFGEEPDEDDGWSFNFNRGRRDYYESVTLGDVRRIIREAMGREERLMRAGMKVFWGFMRHEGQPEELAQQLAAQDPDLSVDEILDAFEDEHARAMNKL